MSLEIAWKQNSWVTDSNLLKSLLVVFGFGSQAFVCGFSRQNICSVYQSLFLTPWPVLSSYQHGTLVCLFLPGACMRMLFCNDAILQYVLNMWVADISKT